MVYETALIKRPIRCDELVRYTINAQGHSGLKLLVKFLLLLSSISWVGCGPGAFQGRVEPAPIWVAVDLNTWVSEIDLLYQGRVIYGRGSVSNYTAIQDRRADAEQRAVQDAKVRFIDHYGRTTGQRGGEGVLDTLSWAEIATPVEGFFDPLANTQYILVAITKLRLTSALEAALRNLDEQAGSAPNSDPNKRESLMMILRNVDSLFLESPQ